MPAPPRKKHCVPWIARLRGALEAPPSLVPRRCAPRSSVQAAPRPIGSLTVSPGSLASGAPLRRRLPSSLVAALLAPQSRRRRAPSARSRPLQVLGFPLHVLDPADHEERLLGELLGDEHRMGQEPLDPPGALHGDPVLLGQLVYAEDRDDVLQLLVPLQDPLH